MCVSLTKQPLPHGRLWCNCVTLVVAKELLHKVCIAVDVLLRNVCITVDVLLCNVCIAVDILLHNVFIVRYTGIFPSQTSGT